MNNEIKNPENQSNGIQQNTVETVETSAAEVSAVQPAVDSQNNVNSKKMTKCKSCGLSMAKSAKSCPNCGAKNKKPFYKRFWFWILAVIVLCIVINMFSGLKKPESVVKAEDLIDAIGKVSIESEDEIIAAEEAVAALTAEELERLRKKDKLEKARSEFDELVLAEKITELQDMINAIGKVTAESGDKISAARDSYDESSDEVKQGINNLSVLETAEKEFSAINVNRVIKLIDEIGEVTLSSDEKIKAAKDAFNILTDEDEAKVTNAKVLTDAEKKLDTLKEADRKARAKGALAKLKSKYDKIEGITWYQPKTYEKYTDTRCFVLPYIGMRDSGYSWLRLRMNYTGDDWIFWTKITFVVDGERYYKNFSYYEIERDNDTEVWEYADISPTDADIEMLRKIATSKETLIRFEGDNYRKDMTVSAADKASITQVLDAYDILSEE